MQQNKISTNWQASSSIEMLHSRAKLLSNIRTFFKQKQVLEVETPILSPAGTTDVFIDSFITSQYNNNYYLHTSPEFAMKRLLASGSGDIYQIAKVFRQEESGHRHNPEFTLLEWYRLDFDIQRLMQEVAELICYAFEQKIEVKYLSYRDCFIKNLSINPHRTSITELKLVANKYNLGNVLSESDDKDRWLELLLSSVIENKLGGTKEEPKMTFLYDYPASQASLAKIEENNYKEKVAKRFELYFAGMELANGFFELDDAQEQLRRFKEDNLQRRKLGKQQVLIDYHLITALEKGLPMCSGVALGIDRLLMVLTGVHQIKKNMSFSFERA
jgi:lysyl-tRNA synthetase class 2